MACSSPGGERWNPYFYIIRSEADHQRIWSIAKSPEGVLVPLASRKTEREYFSTECTGGSDLEVRLFQGTSARTS